MLDPCLSAPEYLEGGVSYAKSVMVIPYAALATEAAAADQDVPHQPENFAFPVYAKTYDLMSERK